MTSEEQLQNLQITYKLRVTIQIWVAKIHGRTTIQKHYLDLSSDTSSLWNFYNCPINVILRGKQNPAVVASLCLRRRRSKPSV